MGRTEADVAGEKIDTSPLITSFNQSTVKVTVAHWGFCLRTPITVFSDLRLPTSDFQFVHRSLVTDY